MKNNDFQDITFNRHSIKKFDEKVKIERKEMLEMLTEATKAPSSVNMQPWRFVVVDTEEGKNILRPLVKFNTRQNDTSAAMIVVFGDMKSHENGEKIYSKAVEQGLMPEKVKEELINKFMLRYEKEPKNVIKDIVLIDSSLVSMQFMLVARAHGYDTCAIGGFEKDKIAEALGLDSKRYIPVLIIAVGKSDYEAHKSVRLEVEEITWFR